MAGYEARTTGAVTSALEYLDAGVAMLKPSDWEAEHFDKVSIIFSIFNFIIYIYFDFNNMSLYVTDYNTRLWN